MTTESCHAAFAAVADLGEGQAAVQLRDGRWYRFGVPHTELARAVARVFSSAFRTAADPLESELAELVVERTGWAGPSEHRVASIDRSSVRLVGDPGVIALFKENDATGVVSGASLSDSVDHGAFDGTVQIVISDGAPPEGWKTDLDPFTRTDSILTAVPVYRERGSWLVGPLLHRGGPSMSDALKRIRAAEQHRLWKISTTIDCTSFSKVGAPALSWLVAVLASEIQKLYEGRRPRCSWRLLVLDPSTYQVSTHLVLPLPVSGRDDHRLVDVPTISPRDLVDPRTGIVTRLKRVAHHPSIPASLLTVHSHAGQLRRVGPWHVDPVAAGTSFMSIEDAELAAIGEAVERYCGNIPQEHLMTRSTWNELDAAGEPAVDPDRLVLFSQQQYETDGFPFQPFNRDTKICWVRGRCLTRGTLAYLPASLVYANWRTGPYVGEPNINNPFYPGIAAGPDLDFAIRAGILEIIERHATMVWWANCRVVPALRTPRSFMCMWDVRDGGQRAWLISIPNEFDIPVIAGFVENTSERLFTAGFAARTDPQAACLKAWAEALTLQDGARDLDDPAGGYRQSVSRGEINGSFLKPWRADRRYMDDYRPDFRDMPDLMCQLQYHLDPRAGESVRAFADTAPGQDLDDVSRPTAGDLSDVVEAVAARGYDIYYADITTPDVRLAGQRVVRVLIPGLVPNYAAAFPFLGRRVLATAAVDLGWHDEPLPDNELNMVPVPHA